jgi:HKD family nuclease
MPDPRGGVRHVIPGKGNYLQGSGNAGGQAHLHLSTGHPKDPVWPRIEPRLQGATEIDILASFVQPSGLDLIQSGLFLALKAGARARILVGDYLYITDPEALRRLLLWMDLAKEECARGCFEVRLAEMSSLQSHPDSFHPKAWRIADQAGGLVVVGSSNISKPALQTGVEWNLLGNIAPTQELHTELLNAFSDLWCQSTVLTEALVQQYTESATQSRKLLLQPEAQDVSEEPKSPRLWQKGALDSLAQVRAQGFRRALIAVATGLGKTWLAAFDALWLGEQLSHPLADLTLGNTEEQPHHILRGIGFEIQQDEEQLLLGANQAAFASCARATLPSCPGCSLGSPHLSPRRGKACNQFVKFVHREAGGCAHQPIRALGMVQ